MTELLLRSPDTRADIEEHQQRVRTGVALARAGRRARIRGWSRRFDGAALAAVPRQRTHRPAA